MTNRIIVGAQWGDEGKAKVVDYLMDDADIVVRFQGGANAGHTVEVGDEKFVFHLIPSGIMRPDKTCVISNGVVLDPKQLLIELDDLEGRGILAKDRLFISDCAHVVFPYHAVADQLKEKAAGKKAIGTTGRGIGPAYADKVSRRGIRVGDLFESELLKERIQENVEFVERFFQVKAADVGLSVEEIHKNYVGYAERLKPFVTDTVAYLHGQMEEGKQLLFEGAQGTILDLDHGTHPFVTSSNTVAGSACIGSGVGPTAINQVIGIVKTYTTRVGNGPFPTELNDEAGQRIQKIGNEIGATTGRTRRCGWFDAVILRKATMVNGLTHLAFTKLDVLDSFDEVKVCEAYEIEGKRVLSFPSKVTDVEKAKPIYKTFPGWKQHTTKAEKWEDLPKNAQDYLLALAKMVKVPIGMVSVGPKRHESIKVEL